MIVAAGGVFRFSGVEHRSAGRTRPCSSTGLSPGHHTEEGGGPTAMRDGKTCGRLCVRPQRRVNCASHRSQAKAVLSTGTPCMCRQLLHRTFVPRTTVSDLLIAANNTTTDPRSLPVGKITNDRQTRSATARQCDGGVGCPDVDSPLRLRGSDHRLNNLGGPGPTGRGLLAR